MFSIKEAQLPDNSFLLDYRLNGSLTDCFTTELNKSISLGDYIEAFYTTPLFKLERLILKWLVSKPSTDADAALLAQEKNTTFAAWEVEAREGEQIILSDVKGETRSWLMCKSISSEKGETTRLYFGSAIAQAIDEATQEKRTSLIITLLMPFHKLYSKALLASARRRLAKP